MKTPCELIVRTVLPTVRASIAKELVENHGLSQKETAEILGVTTAAVSQYLSKKRATNRDRKIFASKEFDDLVRQAAATIATKPGDLEAMKALCRCCMSVRTRRLLCAMHEEIAPQLHDCDFCQELECKI